MEPGIVERGSMMPENGQGVRLLETVESTLPLYWTWAQDSSQTCTLGAFPLDSLRVQKLLCSSKYQVWDEDSLKIGTGA